MNNFKKYKWPVIGFIAPLVFAIIAHISIYAIGNNCSLLPDKYCLFGILAVPLGIIHYMAYPMFSVLFEKPEVVNYGSGQFYLKTILMMFYYGLIIYLLTSRLKIIKKFFTYIVAFPTKQTDKYTEKNKS